MWKDRAELLDQAGDGAPGAAAPASAPAAPAAPVTPASATDDKSGKAADVNWDDFADDLPVEDPPAQPAPGTPAAPAKPAAPAGAAPAAPAQPSQQQSAPAQPVQPAKPASGTEPPTSATPPAQPAQTPEESARVAAEARTALLSEVSGAYAKALTDDQKAMLVAEPEKVLPDLLATAMLDGAQFAYRQVMSALPQLIAQHTQTAKTGDEAWGAFNTAHPDLAKPEYRQAVIQAASVVKAATQGQKLTKEESLARVGKTARALLGLPDPTPGAPAAPGVASGDDPTAAPVAPHTSVGRSRSSAPAASKSQGENPWLEFLD